MVRRVASLLNLLKGEATAAFEWEMDTIRNEQRRSAGVLVLFCSDCSKHLPYTPTIIYYSCRCQDSYNISITATESFVFQLHDDDGSLKHMYLDPLQNSARHYCSITNVDSLCL